MDFSTLEIEYWWLMEEELRFCTINHQYGNFTLDNYIEWRKGGVAYAKYLNDRCRVVEVCC